MGREARAWGVRRGRGARGMGVGREAWAWGARRLMSATEDLTVGAAKQQMEDISERAPA